MATVSDHTALIILNVQYGWDDLRLGTRNNPHAEENMARLLAEWRKHKRPIFHIQHMSTIPDSPLRPNQPGNVIKKMVEPIDGEPILQKSANNAFVGTDLEERLRKAEVDLLVLVGLMTDHCVSSTARLASDFGFETIVVSDATAALSRDAYDGVVYPADIVHSVALANIQDEFATILSANELMGLSKMAFID